MKKTSLLSVVFLLISINTVVYGQVCQFKIFNSCLVVPDTAFYDASHKVNWNIRVYLPADYFPGTKRFPVIYLQEGVKKLNVLPGKLDSLFAGGPGKCILVSVFTNNENEFEEFYKSLNDSIRAGVEFTRFFSVNIKTYIDKNFRTLSSKDKTILAGHGRGALPAFYGAILSPDVYGNSGIFSPDMDNLTIYTALARATPKNLNSKFFFYSDVDDKESDITLLEEVTDILGAKSSAMIYKMTNDQGNKTIPAWYRWFTEFTHWMNADGYNYVIKPW